VPRRLLALGLVACALVAPASFAETDPPPDGAVRRTADTPEDPLAGACDCTHLVYFVASDGADDGLDVDGTIAASSRAIGSWFAAEMQMRPRIDRIGTSELEDITFVRGRRSRSAYPDLRTLTDELAARGFDDPAKRYLVYAGLDRGETCGESTFGWPVLPGPMYAAIYLDSSTCGARALGGQQRGDAIAAHEWLHMDGAVPVTAPRHCPVSPYHVCTAALPLVADAAGIADPEAGDILYPYVRTRLSGKVLDRDRDDYLDHGIPGASDLRRSAFLEPA
jgi:hypothetical protein